MFASSALNGTLRVSPAASTGICQSRMVEEDDDDDYSVVMVDAHWSLPSSPSLSPLSEAPSSPGVEVVVKSELTSSPDFRPSRLPFKVPTAPDPKTFVSTKAAIPLSSNNTHSRHRQDVPNIVNASAFTSSPASRTIGHLPNTLETNVSSSNSPLINDVLTYPTRRPPTSNKVFSSSKDLAAHYGIPHILPPAPRTVPRRLYITPSSSQPEPSAISDFMSMSKNYQNMLAQKSTDTSMTAESEPAQPAGGMAPPNNPEMEDTLKLIADIMGKSSLPQSAVFHMTHHAPACTASPEFKDLHNFEQPCSSSVDMEELLTSPLDLFFDFSSSTEQQQQQQQQHFTSPIAAVPALIPDSYTESPYFESPFEEFLKTPVVADSRHEMLSGYLEDMDYSNGPLFNDEATAILRQAEQDKPADVPPQLDLNSLYTMPPETPLLDTFKSPSLYPSPRLPSTLSAFPSPAPSSSSLPSGSTTSRRRTTATGTRKGLTPESLVPIDAPTQPRKYISPSATSRKELPAIFARKRSRSTAFEGDDELAEEEPGPNATEKEQIEWKRRQNTLAARKSRKRKLLHQQELEDSVERLTQEKEVWRTRALTLRQLLHSHGVPFNEFQD
ncbi:uncharacterized protein LACBIDRAFT_293242 [Laccaria bicolor S238N-H82]|uniref:Predicted protein n=1 Tax=Laccaria bicolor (strain S238N-H82 / ATCC MYA-4686) TaxID=486041 RepID=B0D1Y6_LACBS|nr:uncharacterized protein LACBIDRAFT_293242 [Laccaria bicolor S238N-H82]EDR12074.1 predicted protein [Laccaria bicolor S238N-H82]|eukprot:XP_001877971.1 predicted protein [Laccaria bicolor S238N-H82]